MQSKLRWHFRAVCAGLLLLTFPCQAGLAEVRDAARQGNCPPKKIEVLRQTLGSTGETTYQVECNLPKAKEQRADTKNSIVVKCQQTLCQATR
ncbi:MAG: hypothetical protein KBA75_04450 [Alphaproteobacteria bacterium]|nr:hypothetical protein [Alphaproteobacteria bacterium]